MDGDDDSDEKTPPRKLSALPIEPLPPPPAFPGDPATSPDLTPDLTENIRLPPRPARWWQRPATRGDLLLAAAWLFAVVAGALAIHVAWCR